MSIASIYFAKLSLSLRSILYFFPTKKDSIYFLAKKCDKTELKVWHSINLDDYVKSSGFLTTKINFKDRLDLSDMNILCTKSDKGSDISVCNHNDLEKTDFTSLNKKVTLITTNIKQMSQTSSAIKSINSIVLIEPQKKETKKMYEFLTIENQLILSFFYQGRIRFRLYNDYVLIYTSNDTIPIHMFDLEKEERNELQKMIETGSATNLRIEKILSIIIEASDRFLKKSVDIPSLYTFSLLLFSGLLEKYQVVFSYQQILVIDGNDILMNLRSDIKTYPVRCQLNNNVLTFNLVAINDPSKFIVSSKIGIPHMTDLVKYFLKEIEPEKLITNFNYKHSDVGKNFYEMLKMMCGDLEYSEKVALLRYIEAMSLTGRFF